MPDFKLFEDYEKKAQSLEDLKKMFEEAGFKDFQCEYDKSTRSALLSINVEYDEVPEGGGWGKPTSKRYTAANFS